MSLAGSCFGSFRDRAAGTADIALDIVLPAADAAARPEFGPEPKLEPAPPLLHREREALYLAVAGASSVVADLAARRIVAFVDPGTPAGQLHEVILRSPVWRCLAYEGMVALHGAAIVVEGRSWLLRGPSEAGKSSLALFAALSGHSIVAEEVVWIDTSQPLAAMRGDPWTVHLDPGALEALPALRALLPGLPDGATGRLGIDLRHYAPAAAIEVAPLGGIVFLDRRSGLAEARCRRASRDEALRRFANGAIPGEATQARSRIESARDRLIEEGAFVLCYDGPRQALEALRRLAD